MSKQSEATGQSAGASVNFSLRRLERLADVVFAFALLFLLVTIDLAPDGAATAEKAYSYFFDQLNNSLGFVVSFLIIAYYWITHQEYFNYYTGTNKTHTFIELLYLMAIAGMPFNNDFITAYPMEVAPRLAISSDIFFAGILSFLSWSYATSGNRLVDPARVNPELVRFMRNQALVVPGFAIVGAGAAFVHPLAWDAVLTFGPLVAIFMIKRRTKIAGP
ncbi:MAG: TMEM175 family protein [Gammaproteobacteria bacterium]